MTTNRTTLPKIIRFEGKHDSGEYGAATCPHCGADGRYVWTFTCDDGKRHGAMSGCIKLFPVSPLAEEHKKIIERKADRDKKGQTLASWDIAKLDAIDKVAAGEMHEGAAMLIVRSENARRSAWMDRNKKGRW